jgi:hypothetical protein
MRMPPTTGKKAHYNGKTGMGMNLLQCGILVSMLLPAALQVAVAAAPWSELGNVKAGSRLIVSVRGERAIKGKLVTVSEAGITLDIGGQAKEWPRGDVLSVSQLKRKSMKKPILVGAAIGAGAGAAIGAATGGCKPRDIICLDRSVTTPLAAVAVGITGALSGLIAGLFRQGKVLLYESSP